MFTAFYGMQFNPFVKDIDVKHSFKSNDFVQAHSRLDYLTQIKGIALFIGEPGSGKSFALRSFVSKLNKNLYKTVYRPIRYAFPHFYFGKDTHISMQKMA